VWTQVAWEEKSVLFAVFLSDYLSSGRRIGCIVLYLLLIMIKIIAVITVKIVMVVREHENVEILCSHGSEVYGVVVLVCNAVLTCR
jgi:sugar phosphate permease